MGRKERRMQQKYVSKRLSQEQFQELQSDINQRYIEEEVQKRIAGFKSLFSDCLMEAMKKNGYSQFKTNQILDDVIAIMGRKVDKKREEKAN